MKKAKLFSLIMIPQTTQYLMILEEVEGTRLLPIWIGPSEGISIAAVLQKQQFPRPLTHQLMANIFERLSVKGHEVRVSDFEINWRKHKKEILSKREVFKNQHKAIKEGNITVIRPPIIKFPILEGIQKTSQKGIKMPERDIKQI